MPIIETDLEEGDAVFDLLDFIIIFDLDFFDIFFSLYLEDFEDEDLDLYGWDIPSFFIP